MFCYQCATLGLEPTSVILAVGLVHFNENTKDMDVLCNVNFQFGDQVDNYHRTYEKETVNFWKNQPKEIRDMITPRAEYVRTVKDGIRDLRDCVKQYSMEEKEIVWTRGSIHQVCLDSLFKAAGEPPLFRHYLYRDIRTAIDLTKDTAKNGYCEVPGYELNKEKRYIPSFNVIQEVKMLLFGV